MRAVEKLLTTKRVLAHLSRDYAPVAMYQSFCAEDIVLAHLIFSDLVHTEFKNIHMFTIDTGRMSDDIYLAIESLQQHYGDVLTVYHPDSSELETFGADTGFGNNFYKRSVLVRFYAPLKRALQGRNAWISTGLSGRRILRENTGNKSLNRDKALIAWDNTHQIPCFNPMVRWTQEEIHNYARHHGLPLLNPETTPRHLAAHQHEIATTEMFPAAVGLG